MVFWGFVGCIPKKKERTAQGNGRRAELGRRGCGGTA
jgi:hypothetical protein